MVSRVFYPCCSPAIRLLWQPQCSHSGWRRVGTGSSVETGLSSRMGHLEEGKLSPAWGSAGWAPSWLYATPRPLAGEWQSCAVPACSWDPGAAVGDSTEPLLPWGAALLRSHCSSRGSGQRCSGSGVAWPQQPRLCPLLCCDGEQEPWGTVPQRGWQGRGQPGQRAGRKGLPRAGGAGQEAAGVGVSAGASTSCASPEPHGKEVQG